MQDGELMTRSRGLLEDWRLKRKVLGSKKKFVSEVNQKRRTAAIFGI